MKFLKKLLLVIGFITLVLYIAYQPGPPRDLLTTAATGIFDLLAGAVRWGVAGVRDWFE